MAYQPPTPNVIDNDLQNAPSNEAVYEALATKQPSGNYITALTGQVTATGPGSVAATIATNTVSNSNLAQVATQTFKGRTTAATGNVEDLTATQATAILNAMVGDSGSGGTKGLVPAPAAGDAAAGKYLKADGTWATVSGLPSQTGNANKVLVTDGTNSSWQYAGLGSGSFPANTVVLGENLPAGLTSTKGVLVGVGATVTNNGSDAVSVGYNASSDLQCVAVGSSSRSYYNGYEPSVAVGYNSYATGEASIAIGGSCTANRNSTVIGKAASDAGQGIAIGRDAINSAQGAVAIGRNATSASTGAIVIGYQANSGSSAATNGIIIGYNSGKSTLTGASNTVVGSASFNNASLTSASDNVIIGQGTATAMTTANQCVILGRGAATSVTTSQRLNAIGYNAAASQTTSVFSVYLGAYSGYGNVLGSYNTAVGDTAMYNNTASVTNATCLGYNTTASSSYAVSIGSQANGSGIAIGSNAGSGGSANIVIGRDGGSDYYQNNNGLCIGSDTYPINRVFLGMGGKNAADTASQAVQIRTSNVIGGADKSATLGTLTLSGNQGTGSGLGSDVIISTSPAGTAGGTTPNAYVERLRCTANGFVNISNAQLQVATAGYGLTVKSGTNAKIGVTGAFPGGGTNTVTVSNTSVTSNSLIFLTVASGAASINPQIWVSAITAGTSFVISSGDNSFNGTVGWMIVERS